MLPHAVDYESCAFYEPFYDEKGGSTGNPSQNYYDTQHAVGAVDTDTDHPTCNALLATGTQPGLKRPGAQGFRLSALCVFLCALAPRLSTGCMEYFGNRLPYVTEFRTERLAGKPLCHR
jgi:hypothetical protein